MGENARGQLDYARAQAELARLAANKKGQELFEVVNKLTEHNITTTDLREILDVLYNGLQALEELTKLTLYFHDIKSRIDITLGKPLDKFVQSADGQYQRINLGKPVSKYAADTLWRLAYETTNTAYLINDEANIYTDVSRSSFLPMISLLGQLIALDPERDSQKILSKRNEMEDMTKEMLKNITKKLEDNRNEKVDALQARQEELDETFNKDILKEWLAESRGGERRQKEQQAVELKRNARAVAEETVQDMAAENYGDDFDTAAFLNLGK